MDTNKLITLAWELVAILIVLGYGIFVFTGKANIEGFIFLAVYIIKKRLDIDEIKETR